MRTLQVVNQRSVRSVTCEGFMISHTKVVLHRLNTVNTFFSQLKPE